MKYLKRAIPFILGIFFVLLHTMLPEAVKSELGYMLLIVAFVLIIWGIISFITSLDTRKSLLIVGISLLILGIFWIIINHLLSGMKMGNLSALGSPIYFGSDWGWLGIFIAIIGVVILIRGLDYESFVNKVLKVLISGPLIAGVSIAVFLLGLVVGRAMGLGSSETPGAAGKLWQWMEFGLSSGIIATIANIILAIVFSLIGAFSGGLGSYVAIPRFSGGFTIFKKTGSSFSGEPIGCGCFAGLVTIVYGLIYGFSEWLLYRVEIPLIDSAILLSFIILTVIIWIVSWFSTEQVYD